MSVVAFTWRREVTVGAGDCSIDNRHVCVVLTAFLANVSAELRAMVGRPKYAGRQQRRRRHFPLQTQTQCFTRCFFVVSLTLNPALCEKTKPNENDNIRTLRCDLHHTHFVRYIRSVYPFQMLIRLQFSAQPINRLRRIIQFVSQIRYDESLLFGRGHRGQLTVNAGANLLCGHPIHFRIRHEQITGTIVRFQSIVRALRCG